MNAVAMEMSEYDQQRDACEYCQSSHQELIVDGENQQTAEGDICLAEDPGTRRHRGSVPVTCTEGEEQYEVVGKDCDQ